MIQKHDSIIFFINSYVENGHLDTFYHGYSVSLHLCVCTEGIGRIVETKIFSCIRTDIFATAMIHLKRGHDFFSS